MNGTNAAFTLRRLKPGAVFDDFCGTQSFVKLGTVRTRRGLRHVVRCLRSPFGVRRPGPIASAFFTHVGSVLFLRSSQPIERPALALPSTNQPTKENHETDEK